MNAKPESTPPLPDGRSTFDTEVLIILDFATSSVAGRLERNMIKRVLLKINFKARREVHGIFLKNLMRIV